MGVRADSIDLALRLWHETLRKKQCIVMQVPLGLNELLFLTHLLQN